MSSSDLSASRWSRELRGEQNTTISPTNAHRNRPKTGLIKLSNLATAELFISLASAMRNTHCDHCLRPQDSTDIYSRREDGVVSRHLHGNKNVCVCVCVCVCITGCLCKCINGWLVTPTLGAAFDKTLRSFLKTTTEI